MGRLLGVLAMLCWAASLARGGPNAGGVLLVHATGLAYSSDTPGPPYGGAVPDDYSSVAIETPLNAPKTIWKVYAAFPAGGSPRLQGLAWGMDITSVGSGYVAVSAGGLVNTADFEVTQGGWPITSGASIGQSFPISGTKTTLMTEVYWFAGYAYGGPGTNDVQYFCARSHSDQASMFVDDAAIRNKDPIANYGCLGFGGPGHTHEPAVPGAGSCCATSGTCMVTIQMNCPAPSTWTAGGVCVPNPCPQFGTCCSEDGGCAWRLQLNCTGTWTEGGACMPNPCPQPAGSCCLPSGVCSVTLRADCAGVWTVDGTCEPNPCQQPTGSCCLPNGGCSVTMQVFCAGTWTEGVVCTPNPCLQPTGAFELDAVPGAYPGDIVNVAVVGSNSTVLGGYSINVTFDPAVFEFVGSTLAGTRGEGASTVVAGSTVSSARAGVIYSYSCPPSIPAGTGPMLLVTLRVKASAPGGGTQLLLRDQSPSLNRMSVCGGGTIVPNLAARSFLVLLKSGSCCAADGACAENLQPDCTGTWTESAVCSPNPCLPPTPTERTSWGQVKNRYR